jgi:hypothetical protein
MKYLVRVFAVLLCSTLLFTAASCSKSSTSVYWLADSSAGAHLVTAHGATPSTAHPKFGSDSANFKTASQQYISILSSEDWYFDGDFTIDCWVYLDNLPTSGQTFTIVSQYTDTTHWHFGFCYFDDNGQLLVFQAPNIGNAVFGIYQYIANTTFTTGHWHHIEVDRSGNNWYLFFDGKTYGLTVDTGVLTNCTGPLLIGSFASIFNFFNGYIDELRISKGICRHTANFTPETSAYTPDSYTKLLMHY